MGYGKTIVGVVWMSSLGVFSACESDDTQPSDVDATTADSADTTQPDTFVPDTVVDTTPIDTAAPGCQTFSASGELAANDAPGAFTLGGGVDLGFGDGRPDAIVFEFYSNATGTFDLGSGQNANYGTCKQCVRIVQDIDPGSAQPTHFFQAGGSITIDPTTPPQERRLKVELNDLELVEVKIFADFHSEPVNQGACYERATPITFETAQCVAVCGDNVCGPDGCGGVCGVGCSGGQHCTLDGQACTSDPGCYPLSLAGGELDRLATGVYRVDTTANGLGAKGERDFLQLEFFSRLTGTFDLGEVPNNDYASCKQCVRMVLDAKREFFQAGGTLIVESGSDPLGDPEAKPPGGGVSTHLSSVRLIEVVYDDETFHATPVPNGACVDLVVDGALAYEPPE